MMKKPEDFSVKQLLELFDSGSINVEQLNHLVRELRSAAHEQEPACVSYFDGSTIHTTWKITPPTTGSLTLCAGPVLLEKGPLQSPRATTATNVLLKSFEEAVDEAELSDNGVMISTGRARQLLDLARAGVRPQPCKARAFEIEIRQLTARAEAAEAQLKAAHEQEPVGVYAAKDLSKLKDGKTTTLRGCADHMLYCPNHYARVYAAPVPAPTVPGLDNVEGNILPPIGASVAIHLASSDTWADHTVVGYYVWGPLGGISDSYSRVFVRVVDGQGVLNARLLKDVKWNRSAAVHALQPSRPTESAAAVSDECCATGESCIYEVCALNGKQQCKYCGKGRPDMQSTAVVVPDVELLASIIRKVDGKHSLGASVLAERIVDELKANPQLRSVSELTVPVPDGWRLVPQMLTTKMYDAIVRCADDRRFASWPANIWENACDAAPDAPLPRITEQAAAAHGKNALELEFSSIISKINSVNFKFVDGEPEPEPGSGRSVPVILGVAWKVFKAARSNQSPRITEQEPVFDLDKASWDSIKEAAKNSAWIPKEYFANDWISDVCEFLKNGIKRERITEHPDDIAVDKFADLMKIKLAEARGKGRGGWDDPGQCTVEYLAELLGGHIMKNNEGNFVDIANFCMMLTLRNAHPDALRLYAISSWKEMINRQLGAESPYAPRITEQELREIAGSVLGPLQLATTTNIDQWFEREGRFIQEKLNGARQ